MKHPANPLPWSQEFDVPTNHTILKDTQGNIVALVMKPETADLLVAFSKEPDEKEEKERLIEDLEGEVTELKQEVHDLEDEKTDLEGRIKKLKGALDDLKDEVAALGSHIEDALDS